MAGVSESNGEQMAQVSQPNQALAPELAEPNGQPASGGPQGTGPSESPAPGTPDELPGGLPGGISEAMRGIQEKQERDYHRYVKAYRDYHEHAETYRDWVVGGVRIRARETACQPCSDAGTKVYDAEALPRLPLAGCTGDSDGYCTCTYVVALRRASAMALATEVVSPRHRPAPPVQYRASAPAVARCSRPARPRAACAGVPTRRCWL